MAGILAILARDARELFVVRLGLAGIGLSGGWAISAPGSISAQVDARASVAANTRQSALNDNVGR
jgi:hypothetical protein